MSRFDSPSAPSRATPEGTMIAGAAGLAGQHGWRRRAGRAIAYLVLTCAALAVVAAVLGVVWLFT